MLTRAVPATEMAPASMVSVALRMWHSFGRRAQLRCEEVPLLGRQRRKELVHVRQRKQACRVVGLIVCECGAGGVSASLGVLRARGSGREGTISPDGRGGIDASERVGTPQSSPTHTLCANSTCQPQSCWWQVPVATSRWREA